MIDEASPRSQRAPLDNFTSANGLFATGGTGTRFVAVIFIVSLQLWIYARGISARAVLK